MVSLHDTAYPRFKPSLSLRELQHYYAPTAPELDYCAQHTRNNEQRLGFLVLLKTFQRLGYFIRIDAVPDAIINHIAQCLGVDQPQQVLAGYDGSRNRHKHCRWIRAYLQVKPFASRGQVVLQQALYGAALSREDLADIINVGLETLVRFRYELPPFSYFVRAARTQRTAAYRALFTVVYEGLGDAGRVFLDAFFITDASSQKSLWNELKQDIAKPTLNGLRAVRARYDLLADLSQYTPLLSHIPAVKVKQLAIEARSLDAASMADVEPFKRYALTLSLIKAQLARITDDLCDLFIKQMRKVQHKAEAELARYLAENQDKTDEVLRRYALIDEVLQSDEPAELQLARVRHVVTSRPELGEYSRVHAEFGGKSEARFMWHYFKPRRADFFRILSKLPLVSTSQDDAIEQALNFVLAHRTSRAEWLPTRPSELQTHPEAMTLNDVEWIPESWWKLITGASKQDRFPDQVNRRQLEVGLCWQLVQALKSGDICVVGSDAYSDYRQELLPLEDCAKTAAEYGDQVGLPVAGEAFVAHVQEQLALAAAQTDATYLGNEYFDIIAGVPTLKRLRRRPDPAGLEAVDETLRQKLDAQDLSLLDVLTDTMQWLGWGRFFGPLSGHQRKISDEAKRYILTTFAYGTGLGPAQIAKAMADVSLRQITFINQRHVTVERLDEAIRYVINAYNRFELPKHWGDERRAAADGTQWDIYENNLLSEYHIRYGGYGGVAYYHVSDTYIALFSHFIPCGVWEAVYILDGLIKNESDIQPDVVHGDTQAQSAPAYGLAFLLGIKLMPRIRNWKDLRFYKASAELDYAHINALFTRERVDWVLIERHLPDMLQIAQSIKAGRILPSTILRKLTSATRKNRVYFAFRELGRVVRTLFLLDYLADSELRQLIHAATNKCELFNKFAKWAYFADDVIRENVRDEQIKIIKYNHLIANLLIFHNTYSMTQALAEMEAEGVMLSPELLGALTPYRTGHINRFGRYELRDRNVPEVNYNVKLRTVATIS